MNQMTNALVSAGLAKPKRQMQRLWEMLKDHPGTTAARLRTLLPDIKEGNISSMLSQMERRNMVHIERRPTKVKGPRGSYIVRNLHYFHVIGDTYALKPLKRASKKKAAPIPAPKPAALPPAPAPAPTPEPTPATPPPLPVDISTLMVGEAHALYLALKKLFG